MSKFVYLFGAVVVVALGCRTGISSEQESSCNDLLDETSRDYCHFVEGGYLDDSSLNLKQGTYPEICGYNQRPLSCLRLVQRGTNRVDRTHKTESSFNNGPGPFLSNDALIRLCNKPGVFPSLPSPYVYGIARGTEKSTSTTTVIRPGNGCIESLIGQLCDTVFIHKTSYFCENDYFENVRGPHLSCGVENILDQPKQCSGGWAEDIEKINRVLIPALAIENLYQTEIGLRTTIEDLTQRLKVSENDLSKFEYSEEELSALNLLIDFISENWVGGGDYLEGFLVLLDVHEKLKAGETEAAKEDLATVDMNLQTRDLEARKTLVETLISKISVLNNLRIEAERGARQ